MFALVSATRPGIAEPLSAFVSVKSRVEPPRWLCETVEREGRGN
jgi:hypothetical protein